MTMTRTKEGVLLLDKLHDGRIWVITLNRPERLNALNGELRRALHETYWELSQDQDARVAILTGTGRAFCAGQDLKERVERDAARAAGLEDPMVKMPAHLQDHTIMPLAESLNLWKPMIAAINGLAVGGGFNHAIQCDIRIASENAEFSAPEARWNLHAMWIHHLPRIVGLGNAMEIVLSGSQRIPAQRALAMGLINQIVPQEELMPTAMRLATSILDLSKSAIETIKETVYKGSYLGPFEARRYAFGLQQVLRMMDDSHEGPKAFTENRTPQFRGV